ncbi:phage major capsid protein [Enterococcus faecalis]|uniref:phage major capsid protein n=1 Tax=Enterococcus TaxID=1350 RepID=UPI00037ED143|nr:phage major capsid protein [Enterococcus faecalis]EGO2729452.1 phage major capsid protein [Enterococcus faecalis]EGO7662719.1 phage major capsid protein [Enterococcus faecalis]EHE8185451.1 phage major capsid protein [Enterococcus faecalis]EMC0712047.1 phage major capsid protein [Enterococcus faecalis]EPI32057.1 phage major capsid protein, HK97 family [Enterococcus faecalis VC1B-1]
MALKQIMLQRKITSKTELLRSLEEKDAEFKTREKNLEAAIEEAETEEEQQAVEDEVNKFNEEKEPHDQQKKELEEEIRSLQEELDGLNEKKPTGKGEERKMGDKKETRNKNLMDYHERSDVKEFYDELRERLQMRANGQVLPDGPSGAELIIPDIIVNRIRERIGDFTTLYPLVDKVIAKGRVKLILDVDTSEATWLEMRGALPEEDDSKLTAVEFDGFKIGRIVYIDNSLLEDSVINLDGYLTKRIARSIAKGLDKAIVTGTGKDDKQPDGILPKIPGKNKVTKKPTYEELIPVLGLIDTGEDATGEIVAVMHRQTYYNRIATLTLHVNSNGVDVVQLPNLAEPNFLGLKVVFNNYLPQDKILFGVFDKYTLVERESVRVDMSGHYKFREDQTAVRGLGRYDGKPVLPEAFVEVTLDPAGE